MAAIGLLSMKYMETGRMKHIVWACVMLGISVTIKYPAAIMAAYIALVVMVRSVRDKEARRILPRAALCVLVTAVTVFVIASNLFWDVQQVITIIRHEARPSHLGADGLSPKGNLLFYLESIAAVLGYSGAVPAILGLVYILLHRKKEHAPLLLPALFWVCLSMLKLHWVRWGIPMFVGYLLLAAIGGAWLVHITRKISRKPVRIISLVLVIMLIVLCGANMVITCVSHSLFASAPSSYDVGNTLLREMGITPENSIFEAYTPFALDNPVNGAQYDRFTFEGGRVVPKAEDKNKLYFITNPSYWDMYAKQQELYPLATPTYNTIREQYEMVYTADVALFENMMAEWQNIPRQLKDIASYPFLTGAPFVVYAIPH